MAFFDGLVSGFTDIFGVEPNNLPLIGSVFTNENEKDLIKAMEQAEQSYRQMGPQHAAAQEQGAKNQMSAYGGTNSLLAAMGGEGAAVDFNKLFTPIHPEGHPSAQPAPPVKPPQTGYSGQG